MAGGVLYLIACRRVVQDFQANRVAPIQCSSNLSILRAGQDSINQLPNAATNPDLQTLRNNLDSILMKRWNRSKAAWEFGALMLDYGECATLLADIEAALRSLDLPSITQAPRRTDTPIAFDEQDFPDLLELISVAAGSDVPGWVAPMVDRLRTVLADDLLIQACGYREDESLADVLHSILGSTGSQITRVDLSLVPSTAQHIIAAVVARLILEANERLRRKGTRLPTLLAVEEAHSLILRRSTGSQDSSESPMTDLCREAFERIAREGRKYGLGLIVSSQRPSELSETVLAQCNTFLVHRIVNYRDQEMIARLIPDSMAGLLAEVPSYPARMALLVGAATDVPTLMMVSELPARYRPTAPNPDFLRCWRTAPEVTLDDLANDWTAGASLTAEPDASAASRTDDPPF